MQATAASATWASSRAPWSHPPWPPSGGLAKANQQAKAQQGRAAQQIVGRSGGSGWQVPGSETGQQVPSAQLYILIAGYAAGGCYQFVDTAAAHRKVLAAFGIKFWWPAYGTAVVQMGAFAIVGVACAKWVQLLSLGTYSTMAGYALALNSSANKGMEALVQLLSEKGKPKRWAAVSLAAAANATIVLAGGRKGGANLVGCCLCSAVVHQELAKGCGDVGNAFPMPKDTTLGLGPDQLLALNTGLAQLPLLRAAADKMKAERNEATRSAEQAERGREAAEVFVRQDRLRAQQALAASNRRRVRPSSRPGQRSR